MSSTSIAHRRLHSLAVDSPRFATPADVVRWLGAVQAQDYLAALWAVGLRTPHATEQTVEAALAAGQIIRTWPMRGTIHFVAAEDARWMLELLAPRVIRGARSRLRQLEIDEALLSASAAVIEKALCDGKQLSRPALYAVLEEAGISARGSRGLHILGQLSMKGMLCFGARQGKQPTFTLLDAWAPGAASRPEEEALAELTLRYFCSHGPATVRDFMWWSGLNAGEVKRGLACIAGKLGRETIDHQDYYFDPHLEPARLAANHVALLPPFDEYLVAYRDRSAALDPVHADLVVPGGNGIFNPIVVVDGQVVGTWKRTIRRRGVELAWQPFAEQSALPQAEYTAVAERYGAFLGLPIAVTT